MMQRTYLCVNNNSNNDFITMLSIKILFTINSVKNNYSVKHHLQFLSLKKKHLVLIRKKFISLKNILIKNISFQLKQSISIKKETIFKVNCILTKKITKKEEN